MQRTEVDRSHSAVQGRPSVRVPTPFQMNGYRGYLYVHIVRRTKKSIWFLDESSSDQKPKCRRVKMKYEGTCQPFGDGLHQEVFYTNRHGSVVYAAAEYDPDKHYPLRAQT